MPDSAETVRVTVTLEVPDHNVHIERSITDAWPTDADVKTRLIIATTNLAAQIMFDIVAMPDGEAP